MLLETTLLRNYCNLSETSVKLLDIKSTHKISKVVVCMNDATGVKVLVMSVPF